MICDEMRSLELHAQVNPRRVLGTQQLNRRRACSAACDSQLIATFVARTERCWAAIASLE